MNDSLQVELIENKGPNNLRDELQRSLKWALKVNMAVAFINKKGLRLVLDDIKRVLSRTRSRVRILTRISKDAFNEPSALRLLLDLSEDYEGRAEIRIAKLGEHFHEKMYLFSNNVLLRFFVGSSNLTEEGLISEGEMNVKISCNQMNNIAKLAIENFEAHWNDADELTKEIVDSYASFYLHVRSTGLDKRGKRLWYEVSRLCRKRRPKKVSIPPERKTWLDCIEGFVSKRTERIIEEYTNWDNFRWYTCGLQSFRKCNRNDILVLADYAPKTKKLSANYIRDKTSIRTPDGKYFIAFKRIRGSKCKKIMKKSISTFKEIGLIARAKELRPTSAKILSPEKIELLSDMLNFKAG